MRKYKIESDGTCNGTIVTDPDGKLIGQVVSITIKIKPEDSNIVTGTIEVLPIEANIEIPEGEVAVVEGPTITEV